MTDPINPLKAHVRVSETDEEWAKRKADAALGVQLLEYIRPVVAAAIDAIPRLPPTTRYAAGGTLPPKRVTEDVPGWISDGGRP